MPATFAERLKEAMRIKDIRPTELVKLTGLTKGSISQYLRGTFEAKQDNILKLADALRVNPVWLMGKDELMNVTNTQAVNEIYEILLDAKEDITAQELIYAIDFIRKIKDNRKNEKKEASKEA